MAQGCEERMISEFSLDPLEAIEQAQTVRAQVQESIEHGRRLLRDPEVKDAFDRVRVSNTVTFLAQYLTAIDEFFTDGDIEVLQAKRDEIAKKLDDLSLKMH
jgi:hypothetical protein